MNIDAGPAKDIFKPTAKFNNAMILPNLQLYIAVSQLRKILYILKTDCE